MVSRGGTARRAGAMSKRRLALLKLRVCAVCSVQCSAGALVSQVWDLTGTIFDRRVFPFGTYVCCFGVFGTSRTRPK